MMVPHVNRQEVYGGKAFDKFKKESPYWDPTISKWSRLTGKTDSNDKGSPVNFWMPNLEKYPNFREAEQYAEHLAPGDCLFIPAFHYYHLQGFRQLNIKRDSSTAIFSSLPPEYYAKNATTMEQAKGEIYSTQVGTAISLKFEGNSKLLNDFYDAIEKRMIS